MPGSRTGELACLFCDEPHPCWQAVSKLFDLGHAIEGTDTNHMKTDFGAQRNAKNPNGSSYIY